MVGGQEGISELCRGGRPVGEFEIQGRTDGYSVRNIFEGFFTEEVTGSRKAIFVGGFKFSASEARKNIDSTDSAYQRSIG